MINRECQGGVSLDRNAGQNAPWGQFGQKLGHPSQNAPWGQFGQTFSISRLFGPWGQFGLDNIDGPDVMYVHPRLESILGLDFNKHGKTLYYSIFYPFCYTGGGSLFVHCIEVHISKIKRVRGKMDIIYTKLWGNLDRVSKFIQK